MTCRCTSPHRPPPPPPALVCAELTEAPLSLEGKHSGACVYELVLMGYRVFNGRGRCYAEGWGGCVAAACKLFGCSVLPCRPALHCLGVRVLVHFSG